MLVTLPFMSVLFNACCCFKTVACFQGALESTGESINRHRSQAISKSMTAVLFLV